MSEFESRPEQDNVQDVNQARETAGMPPIKPVKTDVVKPVATYVLMGVTIFVFVLQLLTTLIFGVDLMIALGAKDNASILAGQFWRLITPVFLHSNPLYSSSGFNPTALMHIGFNMYALYIVGPFLERVYGHWRFVLLYFLAGFGGGVASFIFSSSVSIGASGALFGLFAAQAIFFYMNKHLFRDNAKGALQQVVMLVVINFAIGLSPGIDNWGHLGGFLSGLAFAFYAGPAMKIVDEGTHYALQDQHSKNRVLLTGLVIFLVLTMFVVARAVS